MKKHKRIISILIMIFMAVSPVASLTVKLGSVVPAGSDWDLALKQMALEWKQITGGQVNIRIFPGGIAGSEENMIQKMRINQLDMAVLTAIGMNKIVPESFVLSLPFLLADDEEVNFILENVAPEFDDDFNSKGFEVLMWSSTGWVKFFSRDKATTPDQLRRQKIAVDGDETEMMDAWKSLNFHVIPMSLNDTLTGLQSGMIDAFYAPPMGAAAYQWFALTPHMNNLPISPLLGGVVISSRTWNRIPEKYHTDLKAAVQRANSKFSISSQEMNQQALDIMLEYGLQVDDVTESERQEWMELFDEDYSTIVGRGKLIPSETLEMVKQKLNDFRESR
ncbi:TRAP transporter substrate-binding protein DctP [Spirochaeta isovalerica]|uniref:TRAP-type C4-dicarboxylate transport system substrate-binding protein n=1 Tax=Spirochaeta isovalerica TaxID=150 RepID=A0A841RGX9_9SPIO|nr:TRAP transporter substrate-binding protein DctP [Spirochaeta isovalerica]MBB6482039.1 TRAP-type C4-dicarboxylate transport system substrate-binding protein [Spirochaeta isovalerica]